MGAVYRGEQMSLKRQVAVKLLRPEVSSNPQVLQRFNAEAQAVAKLSHPNTVNIYDFGQDTDGSLYIAMEYIEGRSLREAIQKEGPFSLQRALAIGLQVAASLSDAHANSIVHRDLKPDNVMLSTRGKQKDVARVLDFGIAKLRDDNRATQAAMTQAGDMLGTPQYMAPEQIKGELVDGRADVYALGCLIYEMVTARLPYEASSVMAMLSKHLVEDVVPPTQRRPDLNLPPTIDQLILASMQKEPANRPPTMDAFADLMGALLAQLPPDANANRSAGLSIQQGAVGAAVTPAAMFTPSTPYPAVAHTPMGPPPGVPFAPMGPPPGVPYTPPQIAQTHFAPPMVVSQPVRRSRAPLFAIIAVLVLGGAGAGVWAVTKGKSNATAAAGSGSGSTEVMPPDHDDKPDPQLVGSGEDLWADHPGSATITRPTPPIADPDDDTNDDPDAKHPANGAISTAKMPIPAGASITPPAGFSKVSETDEMHAYTNASTSEGILMAPLDAGNNDPQTIARKYAQTIGGEFKGTEAVQSGGASRTAYLFTSTTNGVEVAHVGVLYISASYRLAVIWVSPTSLYSTDGYDDKVLTFFRTGVHLP